MIESDPARCALATLTALFGEDGFVLIGANALACHLEMSWRTTRDLDLAVASSRDDIELRLGEAGWRQDDSFEIRWRTDEGLRLDLIPATRELIEAGGVHLPHAGLHLTLLGFELAFRRAQRIELSRELVVPVAPPEVLALLKMVSFLDRPADRKRDLEDIAHLFEDWIGPADEARFTPELLELGLDYEDVSPFLLGRRLSTELTERTRAVVNAFLARLRDDEVAQAWMLAGAPLSWRRHPGRLLACLRAFERGLGSRSEH